MADVLPRPTFVSNVTGTQCLSTRMERSKGKPRYWWDCLLAGLRTGGSAHQRFRSQVAELKVPVGATFRDKSGTAALAMIGRRAHQVRIETGKRSAEEVEVRSGLSEGSTVIVHPSDKLHEGSAVRVE